MSYRYAAPDDRRSANGHLNFGHIERVILFMELVEHLAALRR